MTTSDVPRLYVWVWLPGKTAPVVAGAVEQRGDMTAFYYGSSYLARKDAVSLYEPELPLEAGRILPIRGLKAPGCIRDAAPDSWGQRVILYRLTGTGGRDADTGQLGLLTYLIESGSDRVGALDFQTSPTEYVPRLGGGTLEEMIQAVDLLEKGQPIAADVAQALMGGSSIGGARPKVGLQDGNRSLIAKLSATTDIWPVVRAEAAAMELGRRIGLDLPRTELVEVMGRDVLLVERFDRTPNPDERKMVVSALTILGLDEFKGARYASYATLADEVRKRFTEPKATLRELFSRMVFNICVGNTDDHARNHAAFWDGARLALTPGYDICPQMRVGGEASQAMALDRNGFRRSQLEACVERAHHFQLSAEEAREIIDHQIEVIHIEWPEVAEGSRLAATDRDALWGTAILNPYALEGYKSRSS